MQKGDGDAAENGAAAGLGTNAGPAMPAGCKP